jgi:hypothetical protein
VTTHRALDFATLMSVYRLAGKLNPLSVVKVTRVVDAIKGVWFAVSSSCHLNKDDDYSVAPTSTLLGATVCSSDASECRPRSR